MTTWIRELGRGVRSTVRANQMELDVCQICWDETWRRLVSSMAIVAEARDGDDIVRHHQQLGRNTYQREEGYRGLGNVSDKALYSFSIFL